MTAKPATDEKIYMLPYGRAITATLVWYYHTCKRQVWLMSREMTPDENHYTLEFGRTVHTLHYLGERETLSLEGVKVDFVRRGKGSICEVKTSSKFLEQAKIQLAYYLYRIKELGVEVQGELLIPEERKRFVVSLNPELERKVVETLKGIRSLVQLERPPTAERCRFCGKCAYREFCFA